MSQTPASVVQLTNVHVTYPGHPPLQAVRGVSFELFAGEVVGLVGESGSGKSTVAKVLAGLIKPASGQIVYQGNPVTHRGVGRRPLNQTGIQMAFQDPGSSLNPRRRVGGQIQDGLDLAERRRRELGVPGAPGQGNDGPSTPEQWLERIGLAAKDQRRYPRSFSGGQRQRIATARALAAEPDVLIGDEPISALDASTQARVAYLMSTLATAQGATLLFISHDLSVVRLIADRLLVMYAGQIVEQGSTEQIWNQPRHPYTQSLLAAIPVPDGAGRLPKTLPLGTTFPPPLSD